ncbi:MAG: alkaline phosphatase D family protein [Pseudomonadota bacterium]|nr:alkaline phosphatase D family protein [Pseudomonadota bacterium]
MPLSRREFLIDSLASGFVLAGGKDQRTQSGYPFQHGVASGDPLSDAIIIWTRLTPSGQPGGLAYRWVIATDRGLNNIVAEGSGYTSAERDYTAKHDVRGLAPGHAYFYAFYCMGHWSDTGRFRTLPDGHVDRIRLAFTSCSNYAAGYFNVYRELAGRSDLDVILHLGDYIYEYANIEESLSSGRINEPLQETVSLADYRARHACYKADKDSQAVHRSHAFIAIWDDHEVANNAWQGGAKNHSDQQGDWSVRLNAAVQAYYEWMPVREISHTGRLALYRGYRFGDLLDLSVLDTRLAGRDEPASLPQQTQMEERTLLGMEQEQWLEGRLMEAQQQGITWKLLGQQVMMAQLGLADQPLNYDQWDGYPAARRRIFDCLRKHQISNFGVLTGDIHSSWAMTLHEDPFASTDHPLGFELVTPAVTSPGITNQTAAMVAASSLSQVMPHLEFVDFYYRGFVLLDITHETLQAEWWAVNRVDSPRYTVSCLKALKVARDTCDFIESVPVSLEGEGTPMAEFSDDLAYLRNWTPSGGTPDGMSFKERITAWYSP